tara:strand:+ start:384 stop:695 length:312 start_codon:yes stop_codon:yes gene_type:complete
MVYIAKFANYNCTRPRLKTQLSPGYGDDDYTVLSGDYFPYYTLAEASMLMKIRKQRMSRLLRILQVPIIKVGTLVLLNQDAYDRVEQAVVRKEVKRGRKPDAS